MSALIHPIQCPIFSSGNNVELPYIHRLSRRQCWQRWDFPLVMSRIKLGGITLERQQPRRARSIYAALLHPTPIPWDFKFHRVNLFKFHSMNSFVKQTKPVSPFNRRMSLLELLVWQIHAWC